MSLNHSPAIVTDGLVFCLDAANIRSYPKSGTTWSDLVGNNIGTLHNSPAFSSDSGGCLVFDGTNEYAAFSSSDLINSATGATQPRSVCIWTKYTASANLVVLEKGTNKHFVLQTLADGSMQWRVSGSSFNAAVSSTSLNDNNWRYFVFTYGSDRRARVYTDGILEDTGSTHSGNADDSVDFVIGSRSGSYAFIGSIACVSIYNRALTGDEVRQNYEATVGRYT